MLLNLFFHLRKNLIHQNLIINPIINPICIFPPFFNIILNQFLNPNSHNIICISKDNLLFFLIFLIFCFFFFRIIFSLIGLLLLNLFLINFSNFQGKIFPLRFLINFNDKIPSFFNHIFLNRKTLILKYSFFDIQITFLNFLLHQL